MLDITSEDYCLLDLKLYKNARSRSPGACALEYESVIQVVIMVFIGYDAKKGTFVNEFLVKLKPLPMHVKSNPDSPYILTLWNG